jgi:homoserine dehydrogenase
VSAEQPKQPPLRVAIAGLGTVGAGTVQIIHDNAALLAARCGRAVEITAVSARNRHSNRPVDISGFRWFDNPVDMATDPDIDVVVELIGGSDGVAKAVAEKALANGKDVVTANKALLAVHGASLAKLAEHYGRTIAFEAAVAGGIPVIKVLREGLSANQMLSVYGILNGTCNYILTQMRETGRDFGDVLDEAQHLGYAEADPSFDVDGIDAAHKLAVLASAAFGFPVNFGAVHVEGIRRVSAVDIAFANELGYRIKLLGIARTVAGGGIEQRVHPCMVPVDNPLAGVDGVFNAVHVVGDFCDKITLVGRGAGAGPTASAVVADLVDVARGRVTPTFTVPTDALTQRTLVPMAEHTGAYYVRLTVADEPGVIADLGAAMRDQEVSISQLSQHGRGTGVHNSVPIVFTTHETTEAAMNRALEALRRLGSLLEPPSVIRIERL